uniref:hypothetical protein n=1 Tax=Streptomyces sp. TG1A-60 TaxID=3129111 RepID=UPI00404036E1
MNSLCCAAHATSSTRPAPPPRVHQHLDLGRGEVDRYAFFGTLRELDFDGVATARGFAREERAREFPASLSFLSFLLNRITKEFA